MKLSDTQLMILSAASQRDDHAVVLPPNLKGSAAKKVVEKLVTKRFCKSWPPRMACRSGGAVTTTGLIPSESPRPASRPSLSECKMNQSRRLASIVRLAAI